MLRSTHFLISVLTIALLSTHQSHADIDAILKSQWNAGEILSLAASKAKALIGLQSELCREYSMYERRDFLTAYGSYFVVKVSEKTYAAGVSVRFVPRGTVTDEQVEAFRKKANKCIEDAGALRDDRGNGLKLFLVDPDSKSGRDLNTVRVGLWRTHSREDSTNYSLDTNCKVILHETLHLLGLWDEYPEPGMSCRSHGDSIMANLQEVDILGYQIAEAESIREKHAFVSKPDYFIRNSESRFVEGRQLLCETVDKTASFHFLPEQNPERYRIVGHFGDSARTYGQSKKIYVPESTFTTKSVGSSDKKKISNEWVSGFANLNPQQWECWVATKGKDVKTGRELQQMLPIGSHQPLVDLTSQRWPLKPAHFRKIAYRECTEKNRLYNFCSSEAYEKKPAGSVCRTDAVPECKNGQWLN